MSGGKLWNGKNEVKYKVVKSLSGVVEQSNVRGFVCVFFVMQR